jgi:phosphoglycerate dehydrogenase-like enzyme
VIAFAGMEALTVWVLAAADDPGLRPLSPAPPGVTFVVGSTPEAFARQPAPDVLFVCGMGKRLLEPVFARASSVRWVHARFAGLDGLLFPALVESSVPLTNARGVFSRSLGEFAVAGLLYFAKDFRRMIRNQEHRLWEAFDVSELAGRVLAIVGYGDIGRAIAERAKPFGMRILAVRRRPEQAQGDTLIDEVLPLHGLRDAIARADDVAVALPLTADTRHLLGEPEIGAMKPTGIFVNVGRGAVVDETALVRALEQDRIKGAALDVYDTEPLPGDHPFWRLPNVLLSPHCADHTSTWLLDATRAFLANLERFRRREPLANVVDKRAGY